MSYKTFQTITNYLIIFLFAIICGCYRFSHVDKTTTQLFLDIFNGKMWKWTLSPSEKE